MKPLAIDLFCGLGGWTEGLLAEGYDVIGFDIERHEYGDDKYQAQLIVQDVLTLHGSQFKNAALIVASPPCQEYSYMAMPWSIAKEKKRNILADPTEWLRLTTLFDACFRIQREACDAAGRHIPMVVENVRGANEWVGRSRWNFGSFHLWGDVPALMPIASAVKVGGISFSGYGSPDYKPVAFNGTAQKRLRDDTKNNGGSWFAIGSPGQKVTGKNPVAELAGIKNKDQDGYERHHPAAFGWKNPRTSSKSVARAYASATIAKIPLPLSRHIAAYWKPAAIQREEGEK